ncbi:hypothetical protein HRH25_13380 [Flavisolibacter sp. BT320]|nr:hypothetical protein [Flavisolibacter longurius]
MAQQSTVERVNTDLDIDEDINLHEKGWVFQRIGWIFIFLLVALAAAGLFGNGLLSKKTQEKGGTTIEYQRFFRHEARMELTIDVHQPGSTQVAVSFPTKYLQQFRIESILPEPKESFLRDNSTHYIFPGEGSMTLTFHLVPQTSGFLSGAIGVNNQQFPITHFIYP